MCVGGGGGGGGARARFGESLARARSSKLPSFCIYKPHLKKDTQLLEEVVYITHCNLIKKEKYINPFWGGGGGGVRYFGYFFPLVVNGSVCVYMGHEYLTCFRPLV